MILNQTHPQACTLQIHAAQIIEVSILREKGQHLVILVVECILYLYAILVKLNGNYVLSREQVLFHIDTL